MINFFVLLFGLTLLYISTTSRIEAYIKMFSLQGILLFLISIFTTEKFLSFDFLLVTGETIIMKTIVIPYVLFTIIKKSNFTREFEPYISNFYSLMIMSLIFTFGFFMSYWSIKIGNDVQPLFFGISISTIISGLFLILMRKKIITHVLGYMILENGIFLLSLAVAKKMPFVVSLGTLLDIFVAVFFFGVYLNEVQKTFKETHVDELTILRD